MLSGLPSKSNVENVHFNVHYKRKIENWMKYYFKELLGI